MKGVPWSARLPLVSVPLMETPKAVTIVLPFYRNSQFVRRQLAQWATFPHETASHLRAVIVDDGSPEPLADALRDLSRPFPVRTFRIEEDRRWNWIAARNIGAHHAETDWLLLTDMDHVIPAETAKAVVFGAHDVKTIYGFSRQESTGKTLAPHPNSWLMTKALFWTIGGYDETLSGFYGTDGDYRRRCAQVAPIKILRDVLVRHEYDGDSSTSSYLRKQPEDAAVKKLIAQRGSHWRPKVLSFPYHEVAH